MAVIKHESGTNFNNWTVVVGDGNYNAPGVPPVTISDILTDNTASHSTLKANVLNRQIMAHNITYYKITDPLAMTCIHTAEYKFKLPYVISTANTDYNGQTVEGGLFVWDGPTTKLDYGLAFQWVINPWDTNFKDIRYWTGSSWTTFATLNPDLNYHTVKFTLDMINQTAHIIIDNTIFSPNVFSATPKTGWSSIVEARFQAETISIFPPPSSPFPKQKVDFKDWEWEWEDDSASV